MTDLLTAPFTVINAPLAEFYGLTAPPGEGFGRVELDPTRYAGLITQASTLARNATSTRTHPILRGKFIRKHSTIRP